MPKIVVDTNVLFEGITKQGGAAGYLIESWMAGVLDARVSLALAYEYADVLSRKLSEKRWLQMRPVLGALLNQAQFVTIYYSWRPASPDKADEHIIDCAMNAGAIVITNNLKDFQNARKSLGLGILSPVEFLIQWAGRGAK
jgi:predicted nucleic acid-binding protein